MPHHDEGMAVFGTHIPRNAIATPRDCGCIVVAASETTPARVDRCPSCQSLLDLAGAAVAHADSPTEKTEGRLHAVLARVLADRLCRRFP